mmetsp:Transcript_14765/g.25226  ORF Transcript_14765/g.25226 Transcript_14765/m.25226 type:complete len:215 (+) Transcript_14765:298-942(+)
MEGLTPGFKPDTLLVKSWLKRQAVSEEAPIIETKGGGGEERAACEGKMQGPGTEHVVKDGGGHEVGKEEGREVVVEEGGTSDGNVGENVHEILDQQKRCVTEEGEGVERKRNFEEEAIKGDKQGEGQRCGGEPPDDWVAEKINPGHELRTSIRVGDALALPVVNSALVQRPRPPCAHPRVRLQNTFVRHIHRLRQLPHLLEEGQGWAVVALICG